MIISPDRVFSTIGGWGAVGSDLGELIKAQDTMSYRAAHERAKRAAAGQDTSSPQAVADIMGAASAAIALRRRDGLDSIAKFGESVGKGIDGVLGAIGNFIDQQVGQRIGNLFAHGTLKNDVELTIDLLSSGDQPLSKNQKAFLESQLQKADGNMVLAANIKMKLGMPLSDTENAAMWINGLENAGRGDGQMVNWLTDLGFGDNKKGSGQKQPASLKDVMKEADKLVQDSNNPEIQKLQKELATKLGIKDPNMQATWCHAAVLYAALKLQGADVGSFVDFYVSNAKKIADFNNKEYIIPKTGEVNSNPLVVGSYQDSQGRDLLYNFDRGLGKYFTGDRDNQFKMLNDTLKSTSANAILLRINDDGHTLGLFRENSSSNNWKVWDTSGWGANGSTYNPNASLKDNRLSSDLYKNSYQNLYNYYYIYPNNGL